MPVLDFYRNTKKDSSSAISFQSKQALNDVWLPDLAASTSEQRGGRPKWTFRIFISKKRPIEISDSHTRKSWWRANNRLKEGAAESVQDETDVQGTDDFPSLKYLIRVLAAQGMHDLLLLRNTSLLRIPTPPVHRLLPDVRWDHQKGETLERISHERNCIAHFKVKLTC